MNSSIYLSRVQISNFRTYGEDFSIDLPAEPSLTVICGMNGLGKTAFFDAIEWALLGEIQRLSPNRLGKPVGNLLTREGANPQSHHVKLSWSNGYHIARSAKETPVVADLISQLKDSNWQPQIHDLSVYLRLTHFLPQATRERFLERDKKAQWNLLQGPAGVERLERFRKMLDDGKARNAFDRQISALQSKVDDTNRRIEEWNQLLADHTRWAAISAATTPVSPSEVQPALAALESKLRLSESKSDPMTRLAKLRGAVENNRERLSNRRRHLSRLELDTRRYIEIMQRLAILQASTAAAENEIAELRRAETEAKEKIIPIQEIVRIREDEKRKCDQLSLAALTVLEVNAHLNELTKVHIKIEAQIADINQQLTQLVEQKTAHTQQRTSYDQAIKGRELARQNLQVIEQLQEQWRLFSRRQKQWESQSAESMAKHQQRESVEIRRIAADKSLLELSGKMKEIDQRLATEQRNVEETNRALAEVVRHIHAEDTACPVCAQVHPPGELLRRAQQSMERYSQKTAALISELRQVQIVTENTAKAQAKAITELAEIDAWLKARDKERAELDELRLTIVYRSEMTVAESNEIPHTLLFRQETFRKQLTEFDEKVAALPPSEQMMLAAQQFESIEKTLRAEMRKTFASLMANGKSTEELRAKLSAADDLIKIGGGLVNLPQFREENLRTSARLENEIHLARGQADEAGKRVESLIRAVEDRINKRNADAKQAKELEAESLKVTTAWSEFGLPHLPNESDLQNARAKIDREEDELAGMLEKIGTLATSFEAWAKREQLVQLESRLIQWRSDLDTDSNDQCSHALRQELSERSANLQKAKFAQQRAEQVARRLTELTGQFSAQALEPLNANISAFNRLISPFPYDFRISPRVTATRTRTEPRVGVRSVKNNRVIERDPEWWLSEGQMSAIGLSVLLGASTVYRWSRWRALLLDDPLQNTDLIHTAAFGDVIRSLIRDEGYQAIVSTHDHDEADFLLRKCRRANLPVRKLELLSFGPNGLRTVFKDG